MVFHYCSVSCGPNKFECKNNHWWKQCLEDKRRCDGLSQCADQSDETGCRKLLFCCKSAMIEKLNGQSGMNQLDLKAKTCDVFLVTSAV